MLLESQEHDARVFTLKFCFCFDHGINKYIGLVTFQNECK